MTSISESGTHLRLIWPQWQGAGTSSIRQFSEDIPYEAFRKGYTVGTKVMEAVLPAHDGPTATVPVAMDDAGTEQRDGIEAKGVVLSQLRAALQILDEQQPDRITTLGGECSVSMAPFSWLARRYEGDLAVIWIDSHPDMNTRSSNYPGYHAMVTSALTGHGDPDLLGALPATLPASHVALAGMHDWTDDANPPIADDWGLHVFPPEALRSTSEPLLAWLRGTGASRIAVHFDVDTIDADQARFGLGHDRGGLTMAQARRVVDDIGRAGDVVALTVAEYVPRQVIQLQRLLDGFPLLG